MLMNSCTIQSILRNQNQRLLHSLQTLAEMLQRAVIPLELEPYRAQMQQLCDEHKIVVERNIRDMQLDQNDIIEEIVSNTQTATQIVTLLSTRLAIPVIRASEADRLSLRIIRWIHRKHPVTADLPPAFIDGATAVWPTFPVYFLPSMERQGLLYQPLLFHEFGHLLYSRHKPEMDALVGELQRDIARSLVPVSQRNDRHANEQARQRQRIVDTWYAWAQEIFCDAVGLAIGGPSFLFAFSTHLSMMKRGDFYRSLGDLEGSAHPVTWLRVQLLTQRAQKLGLESLAQQINEQWAIIAGAMDIREDYHNYSNETISLAVESTVDDMLVEADPRWYEPEEITSREWEPENGSIISLLNVAWHIYQETPETYRVWEEKALKDFLY